MIWGIDGLHEWTPPGAEEAAVILNRLFDDEGAEVWPQYKLRGVQGLMNLGEAEDNRDPKVRQVGENARLSYRRGKTVVYEGEIIARTLEELREAEADLRAAFADETREGRMDVYPHTLNEAFSEPTTKYFKAKALTCEIPDVQASTRWSRNFVVAVRMGDPRYFDNEEEAHKVTLTDTVTAYSFS